MYTAIGEVSKSTVTELRELLNDTKWEHHVNESTDHQASACMDQLQDIDEITNRWPVDTWHQALFLRLGPSGRLYRHSDTGFGFHIPIETNDDVVSLAFENDAPKEYRLEVGKIYHTDRTIEHESFNRGTTNRTHLIMLLKE